MRWDLDKKGIRLKLLALRIFITTIILIFSGVSTSSGNESFKEPKMGLGVGYALVRFDTSVKFTNKQSDRSVFVDAEGTLGLPESDAIPLYYGMYRISTKHAIGFNYFQVRRESSLINFDKTLNDVTIDGQVMFSDVTRFYNISYANTFYEDDRSRIIGKFGINALDIRYVLDASGTITYEDGTITGSLHEETGVFAPLPLFGLDFWYSFTPKWGIATQVTLVGGSYEDVRAFVYTTEVNTRYRISDVFGAVFGIAYFTANVVIEDSLERTDVKYGYNGAYLGLHAVF